VPQIAKDQKPKLYLEDIKIGHAFTSAMHPMDVSQITAFAKQFDPQPFHTDPEAGRQSIFGSLIASGWHTAAISMRLIVENLPIAGGLIGMGGECSWPNPTKPTDILYVKGSIVDIRPSQSNPDRGIVTLHAVTYNQEGVSLQVLTAKLLAFKRPIPTALA